MPAKLLEGKPIAEKIKEDLKKEIDRLKEKTKKEIRLIGIHVGEDPASAVYIKSQCKTAEALGIKCQHYTFDRDISEADLIKFIEGKSQDKEVNGIIVQLPLPKHINQKYIIQAVNPLKDAEGMHPQNLGKVILGERKIAPCTAVACMELIEATGVNLYGKEAVVVGHSDIVGKPVSLMLLNKFATTTICHIGTGERGVLPEHVKDAEILVVAVGKAGLIKGEWIKEQAIVIDVGINRVGDKIVGDVEFDEAAKRASWITPVPGGVGPLTVTMLMRNVVEAAKLQLDREGQ